MELALRVVSCTEGYLLPRKQRVGMSQGWSQSIVDSDGQAQATEGSGMQLGTVLQDARDQQPLVPPSLEKQSKTKSPPALYERPDVTLF